MGQEIDHTFFREQDFTEYYRHLEVETEALQKLVDSASLSTQGPVAGFEIEAWLTDNSMAPSPKNAEFLERLNSPLASAELARFNIELNNYPVKLRADALDVLHQDLQNISSEARSTAEAMGTHLLMIGCLPTLPQSVLNLQNMSDMNRYRALNQQILGARGKPIHLEIGGIEHLNLEHNDVMLESAATSFQIHLQTPLDQAVDCYNASIIASAICVAAGSNAPFLFGRNLWNETRIPLFEQSIEVGGYDAVAAGPLRRVSFGTGYARKSIMECFRENIEHYPVLLPIRFDSDPGHFEYLRLHNGTIWRWNRPLIGFDDDGTPHVRIEHRVFPAGPTITDMIANAAFFYGLVKYLADEFMQPEPALPFHHSKDNFYQSARYGLEAAVVWLDGERIRVRDLLLTELLAQARIGLERLGIRRPDADRYLDIIGERVEGGQTGAVWQRECANHFGGDLRTMTAAYHRNQWSGLPVHRWPLS